MLSMMLKGVFLSGSLIVAIGSQNAFLLKSGLKKQHVFTVATLCFLGDALLMTLGIFGIGAIIQDYDIAQIVLGILGTAFLSWYGTLSLKSALHSKHALNVSSDDTQKRGKTSIVLATVAITFLNPHVYLDTVVVIGGVASSFTLDEKLWFLIGSVSASFLWFYGLGYAATKLVPVFSRPSTWKILDSIVAIIMFYIAFELAKWTYGMMV
ncbi:LysE/ArgO family amino acid transporter [Marinomonas balearica]|uniref:L-lysine exporter family protein LysE/ArgO n=1 Tax=Marinomonas balearica TaxID=491947 RepID=A0A4V3CGD5_9GAMM|nr:LysE/ArgO family amino acid transporter [Marinomonas balearica]TDO97342.1 L-lysine exporter family protein LysE/ArgO [Marinomonas balearica]